MCAILPVETMDRYTDQGCDGIELLDWLFDQNDGILRQEEAEHHGNQHNWSIQDPNILSVEQAESDFLNAFLSGSDSVSGSPLWSPSPSDSGISEDQLDSPQRPVSPPGEPQYFRPLFKNKEAPPFNLTNRLNGWESGFPPSRTGGAQYPRDVRRPQLSPGFPLTVKDLLLSGAPEAPPQPPQQSTQELVLNEDEKKLLAKEGVTLPCQLPLTKYEERMLKKIRRKIRNKQSAQESRKKKKEYIDGLESRMAACNAHNQELQRKVFRLEKCNTSLMEQLRRLQALFMNSSNKTAQTGTCVLVLLLSFSLILFPSLKPFSNTELNQGDFSPVRIQSRSLHSLQASRVLAVSDYLSATEDEPESPARDFPGGPHQQDISSVVSKQGVGRELSGLELTPHNNSQEDELSRFHADPITGHIATLTLDPNRRARLRPHADDM